MRSSTANVRQMPRIGTRKRYFCQAPIFKMNPKSSVPLVHLEKTNKLWHTIQLLGTTHTETLLWCSIFFAGSGWVNKLKWRVDEGYVCVSKKIIG